MTTLTQLVHTHGNYPFTDFENFYLPATYTNHTTGYNNLTINLAPTPHTKSDALTGGPALLINIIATHNTPTPNDVTQELTAGQHATTTRAFIHQELQRFNAPNTIDDHNITFRQLNNAWQTHISYYTYDNNTLSFEDFYINHIDTIAAALHLTPAH